MGRVLCTYEDDEYWWYEDDGVPVVMHIVCDIIDQDKLTLCNELIPYGVNCFYLYSVRMADSFNYLHKCEKCFSNPVVQMMMLSHTELGDE